MELSQSGSAQQTTKTINGFFLTWSRNSEPEQGISLSQLSVYIPNKTRLGLQTIYWSPSQKRVRMQVSAHRSPLSHHGRIVTFNWIELSSHISSSRDSSSENILHFKILLGFNVLLAVLEEGNKFRYLEIFKLYNDKIKLKSDSSCRESET